MNIALIGGTGFIGSYLVDLLVGSDRVERVRVLSRRGGLANAEKVDIVMGDVFDKQSLKELIVEGAVVVNLAYLADAGPDRNLELIGNIVDICGEKNASKLIHLGTAVVAGRAEPSLVTEESMPRPFSEYDRTKMLVERAVLDDMSVQEIMILRPTAVFGPKGKNLLQMANELSLGNKAKNYLKSCVYGYRTMNLVSVEDVISALAFLIFLDRKLGKQVFIVADDGASHNNYIDVERIMMRTLGVRDYPLPRFVFPRLFLRCVLILLGKSNIDGDRRYSSVKLEALGWSRGGDFDYRLERFAEWYRGEHHD